MKPKKLAKNRKNEKTQHLIRCFKFKKQFKINFCQFLAHFEQTVVKKTCFLWFSQKKWVWVKIWHFQCVPREIRFLKMYTFMYFYECVNPNLTTGFTGLVGKVRKKLSPEGGRKGGRRKKARAARPPGPGLEPGTCRLLGEGHQLHAPGGCLDKQAFPCL